jgi:hypothetical protein
LNKGQKNPTAWAVPRNFQQVGMPAQMPFTSRFDRSEQRAFFGFGMSEQLEFLYEHFNLAARQRNEVLFMKCQSSGFCYLFFFLLNGKHKLKATIYGCIPHSSLSRPNKEQFHIQSSAQRRFAMDTAAVGATDEGRNSSGSKTHT